MTGLSLQHRVTLKRVATDERIRDAIRNAGFRFVTEGVGHIIVENDDGRGVWGTTLPEVLSRIGAHR